MIMRLFRRLLCPTDLGPASWAALRHAVELGVALGAELSVLHVSPPPPVTLRSLFDRAVRPHRQPGGRADEPPGTDDEGDDLRLAELERFVRTVPGITQLRVRLV